jgi:RNA polymerase sigma-70 factor (ECF subfamily)
MATPRLSARFGVPYRDRASELAGRNGGGRGSLRSLDAEGNAARADARDERAVIDGLVERAQRGDPDAFGALYDRYQPEILRYLVNHVRDLATAEDLTQLVFLKAWQAIPRYEQRNVPFKSWLYRMAHNQMVDHFRTRRVTVDLDGIDRAEPAEAENAVIAGELRAHLERALQRLSGDHREVLVLRFLMEKSAAEIGEIMGRKEVTVRGLQLRALRALRRELEAMGGEL